MGSKNEGADLRTKNRRGWGTGGSQWLRDGQGDWVSYVKNYSGNQGEVMTGLNANNGSTHYIPQNEGNINTPQKRW